MQPTFDPKISRSDLNPQPHEVEPIVPFWDRFYVAGNASFVCLLVAIGWSAVFIAHPALNLLALLVMAAPLVATGMTVLIVGVSRHMVPKVHLSTPLHVTVPLVWCLVCYLTVQLMATQETTTSQVPEAMVPVLVWMNPANLVPVCLIQMAFLGMMVWVYRTRERT